MAIGQSTPSKFWQRIECETQGAQYKSSFLLNFVGTKVQIIGF
jgi:hypothetical protein